MPIDLPAPRTFDPLFQEAWKTPSEVVVRADRISRRLGVVLLAQWLLIAGAFVISDGTLRPLLANPLVVGIGFLALIFLTSHSEVRISEVEQVIHSSWGTLGLYRRQTLRFSQVDGVCLDALRRKRSRGEFQRILLDANGKRLNVILTDRSSLAFDLYQYFRHDLGFSEGGA